MRSCPPANPMRLLFSVATSSFLLIPSTARAQEGTWTFSGSAGYAYISLSDVKADMRRDVDIYNSTGHQLPPFPSVSPALAIAGKVDYRFERDFSASLSLFHASRRVESSYENAEHSLALVRDVGSTAALLGIAQHFPAGPAGDLYIEGQLGMLFAKATSSIDWIRTYKMTDSSLTYVTEVQDDTRGTFRKSKLIFTIACGGTLAVVSPFIVRAEAVYRFAQIGKIDGTTTKFGLNQDQTTSINFDYSGFAVTIGIGIELNR